VYCALYCMFILFWLSHVQPNTDYLSPKYWHAYTAPGWKSLILKIFSGIIDSSIFFKKSCSFTLFLLYMKLGTYAIAKQLGSNSPWTVNLSALVPTLSAVMIYITNDWSFQKRNVNKLLDNIMYQLIHKMFSADMMFHQLMTQIAIGW
jgi:hypothetical protein